jgi:hypothetical protein
VKKITFLIPVTLLFVIMMPCSIQEHQLKTVHPAAMYVSSNTALPSTVPAGRAIYLPFVFSNFSTTPPVQNATATPTQTPTVTSTPIHAATPTPNPNTFIIGHITDAHIGAAWVYSQRLPQVVSAVSQHAHAMVDTGDCTENGTLSESIEYMNLVTSTVSIPWWALPGNHDIPWSFARYIGPLEWSWDIAGYRLIGINTQSINYTSLDEALTTEKPCIIFGHYPLPFLDPTDQARLRQRFKAYDVPIYVAGHTHLDSLETDPESGAVLLTGQRSGLGHYRLITLRGREVEMISFRNGWR